MSDDDQTTIVGEVTDIFAHRCIIETGTRKFLVDLGPDGADQARLMAGECVTLTGEMTPSEMKVRRVARAGAPSIEIDRRGKPHRGWRDPADPDAAVRTAEANGFTVLGRPRRRPRHFEVLGRDAAGDLLELHVELDGTLRKTRPVEADDPRWRLELQAAP